WASDPCQVAFRSSWQSCARVSRASSRRRSNRDIPSDAISATTETLVEPLARLLMPLSRRQSDSLQFWYFLSARQYPFAITFPISPAHRTFFRAPSDNHPLASCGQE